ncbi:MAG: GNAT family N-acetyltransferase [Gammaproteobacteria bacterium]|nr:GNAT family N-acetyltransferase [Gammaproteobacteria bacterium]
MGTELDLEWQLHGKGSFDCIRDEWDQVQATFSQTPLLDADFVSLLLAHFGSGKEVVAICRKNGIAVAVSILKKSGMTRWQTFQPSQAPLGMWIQDPAVPLTSLFQSLQAALPGFPTLIGLTQQDPDIQARPSDINQYRTLEYIQTARITVVDTFSHYWAKRGKNLRRNLKKQRNHLEKDGVLTRLEAITSPQYVAQAIGDYAHLESGGWKAKVGTAVSVDNPQGRFYRCLLEKYCERGEGIIYRYWLGEHIGAMDLCIRRNGVFYILKTTYDEALEKFSAAFLMREEIFRDIFDNSNMKTIEFYGRVMDWHTKWADEMRTMYHVNWIRWPVLARLWKSLSFCSKRKILPRNFSAAAL